MTDRAYMKGRDAALRVVCMVSFIVGFHPCSNRGEIDVF